MQSWRIERSSATSRDGLRHAQTGKSEDHELLAEFGNVKADRLAPAGAHNQQAGATILDARPFNRGLPCYEPAGRFRVS
jgi:hypothetical protein